jgi:hypothetical protein
VHLNLVQCHTDKLTGNLSNRNINTAIQTNSQMDKQTKSDRQMNRQTDEGKDKDVLRP